jgi:Membrane-associated apoptosis protein
VAVTSRFRVEWKRAASEMVEAASRAAADTCVAEHRRTRLFVGRALRRIALAWEAQPQGLLTDLQLALAALALGRSEVLWFFRHMNEVTGPYPQNSNPPPNTHTHTHTHMHNNCPLAAEKDEDEPVNCGSCKAWRKLRRCPQMACCTGNGCLVCTVRRCPWKACCARWPRRRCRSRPRLPTQASQCYWLPCRASCNCCRGTGRRMLPSNHFFGCYVLKT